MRNLLRWVFDGALLGTVMGAIFAGCFAPIAFVLSVFEGPLVLALILFIYLGPLVVLWVVLGALQGALLYASWRLRHLVRADLAPALFAWLGLLTGLGAAGLWLAQADWCMYCCERGMLPAEDVWASMILVYGAGSMLVLPVFAVFRGLGRTRALLAAGLVAVVVLPALWWAGLLAGMSLEAPMLGLL
jgi:hypothetical protein